MASAEPHGRRSIRVLLKVALAVWCDGSECLRAHTIVVNDQGDYDVAVAREARLHRGLPEGPPEAMLIALSTFIVWMLSRLRATRR